MGSPVRLHPETAACSNFDVAKIFVNADLTKDLPKQINFSKNGIDFGVEFFYPWLPPRCSICEIWGHLDARCVANKKRNEEVSQEKSDVESKPVSEVTTVLESNLQGLEAEQVTGKEKLENVITQVEKVADANSETEWSTVSPSKAGRSPAKHSGVTEQSTSIVSASKFAVLSIDEEDEEEGEISENNNSLKDATETAGEIMTQTESQQIEKKEDTEKGGKGRAPSTRISQKKKKATSETSTQVTKDILPVISSKKVPRKNL